MSPTLYINAKKKKKKINHEFEPIKCLYLVCGGSQTRLNACEHELILLYVPCLTPHQ